MTDLWLWILVCGATIVFAGVLADIAAPLITRPAKRAQGDDR